MLVLVIHNPYVVHANSVRNRSSSWGPQAYPRSEGLGSKVQIKDLGLRAYPSTLHKQANLPP